MSTTAILTPDQRVRVFISSTLQELAEERAAARRAIRRLHLAPVWYESGAATIAAATGQGRRAVVLTEVALGLLSATGWQDDARLAWFWKTVAPAYEALDEATLMAAREQARRLPPDAALRYAASDDDPAALAAGEGA